eukprot:m.345318 g.345318  ORF g.345318 m.345318 type:complete len:76 (-) comp26104_c0_seq1:908-1135(-)
MMINKSDSACLGGNDTLDHRFFDEKGNVMSQLYMEALKKCSHDIGPQTVFLSLKIYFTRTQVKLDLPLNDIFYRI